MFFNWLQTSGCPCPSPLGRSAWRPRSKVRPALEILVPSSSIPPQTAWEELDMPSLWFLDKVTLSLCLLLHSCGLTVIRAVWCTGIFQPSEPKELPKKTSEVAATLVGCAQGRGSFGCWWRRLRGGQGYRIPTNLCEIPNPQTT